MWKQISLGPPVAQVRGKNVHIDSHCVCKLASNHSPSGVSLVLFTPLEACPRILFSFCHIFILCACSHHSVIRFSRFWFQSVDSTRLHWDTALKDSYSFSYSWSTTGFWNFNISWLHWRCASFLNVHTMYTITEFARAQFWGRTVAG